MSCCLTFVLPRVSAISYSPFVLKKCVPVRYTPQKRNLRACIVIMQSVFPLAPQLLSWHLSSNIAGLSKNEDITHPSPICNYGHDSPIHWFCAALTHLDCRRGAPGSAAQNKGPVLLHDLNVLRLGLPVKVGQSSDHFVNILLLDGEGLLPGGVIRKRIPQAPGGGVDYPAGHSLTLEADAESRPETATRAAKVRGEVHNKWCEFAGRILRDV
jgi:hypothetical protein